MSSQSSWRGHTITFKDGAFVFDDTGEPTVGSDRSCGHCGKHATAEGHDACIGTLPGVMNACCGHGVVSDTYMQMLDGKHLQGWDAVVAIRKLKRPDNGNRIDGLDWPTQPPLPRACWYRVGDEWNTGTLHAWSTDYEESSHAPFPVGVIEDEVGGVYSIYVDDILFSDPEAT